MAKIAKISKEELLAIARISCVDIHEDEIEALCAQLDSVLSYAARVTEIGADVQEPSTTNVNIVRQDVIIETNPEPILAQAPEREETFFVVPKILDNAH